MDTYTLWVCRNCMLHHANGECGDCHWDRGHEFEPWSYADKGDNFTMGLLSEDHHCDRDQFDECDCETLDFSWHMCDGCGSNLGGSRHAFTGWIKDEHQCSDDCFPMYACGNG